MLIHLRATLLAQTLPAARQTLSQKPTLGVVPGLRQRALEMRGSSCRLAAPQLELAVCGRVERVLLQAPSILNCVQSFEPAARAVALADGDRAIERYYGRWPELEQAIVQGDDARPIRGFEGARADVRGGKCGLQVVSAELVASCRELELFQAFVDQCRIPASAVLIDEGAQIPRFVDARG